MGKRTWFPMQESIHESQNLAPNKTRLNYPINDREGEYETAFAQNSLIYKSLVQKITEQHSNLSTKIPKP